MDLRAEIDALVDVGRRSPGSDAERRAAAHLKQRLEGIGRGAGLESFEVWPAWPLGYAILAGLAVLGSVLSVSLPALGAALVLVGVLLTFLEACLLLPTVRRLLGRRASQNVVSWGDFEKPGRLVLVAHYDAGRGGIALGQKAEARRAALGKLIRRPIGPLEPLFWAQLAVLVCCVLRLASLSGLLLTVVQFIPTVLLIVAVALLLDIALSPTTGGENDNATGTALALRLAERFGGGQLDHFDVHVILTGGQKAVAAGSRAFFKRHRRHLDPGRTVILNLDAVGSGTVRYTSREGPLVAIKSHPQLVQLCQHDRRGRRRGERLRRPPDHEPLAQRRLRRPLGRAARDHDQLPRPARLRARAPGRGGDRARRGLLRRADPAPRRRVGARPGGPVRGDGAQRG